MKFLERPWYLFATSLFTNSVSILIIYRLITAHKLHFFTLDLFKSDSSPDVFRNSLWLPHAYVFFINVLIVVLFANSEIIGRVAGTCPFYFYAWA